MKVFINGLSAKSAGGKSVFINLVRSLIEINTQCEFFLLVGEQTFKDLNVQESDRINWVNINSIYGKSYYMPYTYISYLPKLLEKYKISAVLNLADVPIKTSIPQILLFDWPYAAYPESTVWNTMALTEKMYRKSKLWFFKRYLKYIDVTLAQSEAIKQRLEHIFPFRNVGIAPNAVSLDNLDGGEYKNFELPEGKKFLYLTRYYPHKNLDIFIDLAQKIKNSNLEWKLIITVDRDQSKSAELFLKKITQLNLDEIIINLGSVDMKNVPSLYKQCDYLLMPTLLESFSGTYVEAMYHKIPILTSDLDFAHSVCKDAALYFDPLSPNSIIDSMKDMVMNNRETEFAKKGSDTLNSMATWSDSAKIINESILKVIHE